MHEKSVISKRTSLIADSVTYNNRPFTLVTPKRWYSLTDSELWKITHHAAASDAHYDHRRRTGRRNNKCKVHSTKIREQKKGMRRIMVFFTKTSLRLAIVTDGVECLVIECIYNSLKVYDIFYNIRRNITRWCDTEYSIKVHGLLTDGPYGTGWSPIRELVPAAYSQVLTWLISTTAPHRATFFCDYH